MLAPPSAPIAVGANDNARPRSFSVTGPPPTSVTGAVDRTSISLTSSRGRQLRTRYSWASVDQLVGIRQIYQCVAHLILKANHLDVLEQDARTPSEHLFAVLEITMDHHRPGLLAIDRDVRGILRQSQTSLDTPVRARLTKQLIPSILGSSNASTTIR